MSLYSTVSRASTIEDFRKAPDSNLGSLFDRTTYLLSQYLKFGVDVRLSNRNSFIWGHSLAFVLTDNKSKDFNAYEIDTHCTKIFMLVLLKLRSMNDKHSCTFIIYRQLWQLCLVLMDRDRFSSLSQPMSWATHTDSHWRQIYIFVGYNCFIFLLSHVWSAT